MTQVSRLIGFVISLFLMAIGFKVTLDKLLRWKRSHDNHNRCVAK